MPRLFLLSRLFLAAILIASFSIVLAPHSFAKGLISEKPGEEIIEESINDEDILALIEEDNQSSADNEKTKDNMLTPEEIEAEEIKERYGNLKWDSSVFFNAEQTKSLYEALIQWYEKRAKNPQKYIKPIDGGELIFEDGDISGVNLTNGELGKDGAESGFVESPSNEYFYLNSVLYFNPSSWTIWLNNQRIRKKDIPRDIYLLDVTETSVSLIGQNFNFDITSVPNFDNFVPYNESDRQSLLQSLKSATPLKDMTSAVRIALEKSRRKAFSSGAYEWDLKSTDGDIVVDSYNGIFKITLKINQRFDTKSLSFIEGKPTTSPIVEENMPKDEESIIDNVTEEIVDFAF